LNKSLYNVFVFESSPHTRSAILSESIVVENGDYIVAEIGDSTM